jgi:soluble lytic murein transglycosylase-like protein
MAPFDPIGDIGNALGGAPGIFLKVAEAERRRQQQEAEHGFKMGSMRAEEARLGGAMALNAGDNEAAAGFQAPLVKGYQEMGMPAPVIAAGAPVHTPDLSAPPEQWRPNAAGNFYEAPTAETRDFSGPKTASRLAALFTDPYKETVKDKYAKENARIAGAMARKELDADTRVYAADQRATAAEAARDNARWLANFRDAGADRRQQAGFDEYGRRHAPAATGGTEQHIARFRVSGQRHGVDPLLLQAMAALESGGNPNAVSPRGAKGVMQFMDGTAKAYGITDPFDPDQSIEGGAKYIGDLMRQYKNMDEALADYNGGPKAVAALRAGKPWRETREYIATVKANMTSLQKAEATQARQDAKHVWQRNPDGTMTRVQDVEGVVSAPAPRKAEPPGISKNEEREAAQNLALKGLIDPGPRPDSLAGPAALREWEPKHEAFVKALAKETHRLRAGRGKGRTADDDAFDAWLKKQGAMP